MIWVVFKRKPWLNERGKDLENESEETQRNLLSPLIETKIGPFEARGHAERAAVELIKRNDIDPGSIRIG